MGTLLDICTPDLNGADSASVIEILVSTGDVVQAGDHLITVETEKAAMEIPSPHSGTVREVVVGIQEDVTEGDVLIKLEPEKSVRLEEPPEATGPVGDLKTQVVILGSGPGGYSAAFRAADLGKKVVLVERHDSLGGVCLNTGCIPSKSLLHAAKVISETREMRDLGIRFSSFELDTRALRNWKNRVIGQLNRGLATLAEKRNVLIVRGEGKFLSSHEFEVRLSDDQCISVGFEQAVVAAGSEPVKIPGFPYEDPRVISSAGALEPDQIPGRLLVVGGGIIGLEMAAVYHELGAKVTIVEFADSLIPGTDPDLVKPLHRHIQGLYENIFVSSRVEKIESTLNGMFVTFSGSVKKKKDVFDQVLVAVGRQPNGKLIDAEKAGIKIDERGFIPTDHQMRTNISNIFAVGDVAGPPMLAHKAAHEGKVAAEVIAGMDSTFDGSLIPYVAYTDPEVAWVGMTETRAKESNAMYEKGVFPWAASGRALSLERKEGMTKALFDPKTGKIIGAGIVGINAGDLISEAALAIRKGCTANEIASLIHPHPTLSETIGFAAEVLEGTIVEMYVK
ncbi:MAG: dihydrolipoyl dehydrogenase [Gammaproteobacteria bacterium]|nr:dihydrolipoyl dehydrogenase [Gammaproteobacteria bacterium]